MSSRLYQQRPIEWETFLNLMNDMDAYLVTASENEMLKLAAYQTAIAFGCYIGPNSTDLLNLTWRDLLADKFYFKFEERTPSTLDDDLKTIIHKNFDLINPSEMIRFLLYDNFKANHPIRAKRFNTVLNDVLKQFGVDTPNPNYQTLRKTYAHKVYLDLGGGENAIEILSEEFNYSPNLMRTFIRINKS